MCSGEENLFGLYLREGRRFPQGRDILVVADDAWSHLQARPEFIARKEENVISYWWDRMIERFINDYEVRPDGGPTPSEHERVVRVLASENRFSRRILSGAFLDWLQRRQTGARNVVSGHSKVAYVFGVYPRDWARERRAAELRARCYVARSVTSMPTVVGIATEVYEPSGYSMDAVYMHLPEWTAEDERLAEETKAKFGIMQNPTLLHRSEREFPSPTGYPTGRTEKNRRKRARRARRS